MKSIYRSFILYFPVKVCPHGTPLPGEDNHLPDNLVQLDSVQVGSKIQIVIISESLEESVKLLKFLQEKNIVPGQQHYVTEEMEVTKTIILEAGKKTAILPFDISTEIGIVVLQEPG